MEQRPKYYLVEGTALPEVLHKVMDAKRALESGRVKTVNDAADMAGISRSAFYKYKDAVRPFYDNASDRIVTFYLLLDHSPGVLSRVLYLFADLGANILTINQNIPVNGQATVTVSAQTGRMRVELDEMLTAVREASGVLRFDLLAGE